MLFRNNKLLFGCKQFEIGNIFIEWAVEDVDFLVISFWSSWVSGRKINVLKQSMYLIPRSKFSVKDCQVSKKLQLVRRLALPLQAFFLEHPVDLEPD